MFVTVLFILCAIPSLKAQPKLTTLKSFSIGNPFGSLIISNSMLYGTTQGGGKGLGAVFRINTDGTGYTNIYNFNLIVTDPSISKQTNGDGAIPKAGLIISDNTLYGTTDQGGRYGEGTIFRVNTDGACFTNLHNFTRRSSSSPFTNSDGAYPVATLFLSSNILYGTTEEGGIYGGGIAFKVNVDGSGFTNLHNFPTYSNPTTGLLLSSNTLYGTSGDSGLGNVYKINTDGSGYVVLHGFTGGSGGGYPYASLIISDNTLYGTTQGGGNPGYDTIFAVNTDGSDFRTLYHFTALNNYNSYSTNSDGAAPRASLILFSNVLYGAAAVGGKFGQGTVFKINTDGSGFKALYNFTALTPNNPNYAGTNSDGANPQSGLILSGGILYGTAENGGGSTQGTVFALSLVPSLGIALTNKQLVLSWPTWCPSFELQIAITPASIIWSNVTGGINTIGDNYVFTNTLNSDSVFFRLKQ